MIPTLFIAKTEIIHETGLNIRTGTGSIYTDGYSLAVTLSYHDNQIVIMVENLLVTEYQSPPWCKDQLHKLAGRLAQQERFTPGEISRLLKCGHEPLAQLGIPIPPLKHYASGQEMREFHERTGKAMMYIENDIWHEWAIAYNAWIREYPELAEDYGCTLQDEKFEPVISHPPVGSE